MQVAYVTAEVVPFSKVGGLADVAGALPLALHELGVDVSVFTPWYNRVEGEKNRISGNRVFATEISMGPLGKQPLEVYRGAFPGTAVPVFLFRNDYYFGRSGLYTDPSTGLEFDDGAYRFIFFMKACREFIHRNEYPVEVLHCNDSHTALLPALFSLESGGAGAAPRPGTLLTIHNIAYQGLYPPEILAALELPTRMFYPLSPFEYYGKVNFLKAGIIYADIINTVSERYAREIQESKEYGCGLEGILRQRKDDLYGILNGVDYAMWDPARDPLIPARYDSGDVRGKAENKRALLQAFNLRHIDPDRPVIGMVGRLVDQKGLDLLAPLLDLLAQTRACLLVLGTGLPEYHELFQAAALRHPDFLGVKIGFDNRLAHLIEAGSDMFLMPSRYEPCGLNQMYSLRYGTVPVVRATGGLADTVVPYNPATGEGTGFVFEPYDPAYLLKAIMEGIALHADQPRWLRLMRNGMEQDFSWRRSAFRYQELYRKAVLRRERHSL